MTLEITLDVMVLKALKVPAWIAWRRKEYVLPIILLPECTAHPVGEVLSLVSIHMLMDWKGWLIGDGK
jgi:hypothetical protein